MRRLSRCLSSALVRVVGPVRLQVSGLVRVLGPVRPAVVGPLRLPGLNGRTLDAHCRERAGTARDESR